MLAPCVGFLVAALTTATGQYVFGYWLGSLLGVVLGTCAAYLAHWLLEER